MKKENAGKRRNSRHKKILIVSSHTQYLCWVRMDMMKEFVQSGYVVIAVGQEPERKWKEIFHKEKILYRQIRIKRNGVNPFGDIKTLYDICQIIKKDRPDKIFCYQAKPIVYTCLAAGRYHIPEVYVLMAGLGSVFRGESIKEKIVKKILSLEFRIALQFSRKVIFQNPDDRQCFINEKIVEISKTEMINGSGVDTEKFADLPFPEKPAFLMICRLIKDKGLIEYLEACKALKKEYPDTRCILVGPYDTNPSAVTKKDIEKYTVGNIVEYYGEQDDVRPYLEQCSVFVLPSYHEGTPKVVLEAMASSRAVITTDAPGCRETVSDGNNGFLVPVKNISMLLEKMRYMVNNPDEARRMGESGRRIAVKKYDVHKVNAEIKSIMKI